MRKIVLLAVALFGFTAAFAQSDVLTVAQEANDALGAKNYAKAAELLEKVIADGSASEDEAVLEQVNSAKKNLPIATFYVGRTAAAEAQKLTDAAARDAKYAEAIATLEKAVKLGTDYKVPAAANNAKRMVSQVYLVQGGAYFNANDYAKAADLTALAGRVTTAEGKITAVEQAVAGLGDMAGKDVVAEADLESALATKINDAYGAVHSHSNKTVLDGITAANVASWNGKAKVYAASETVDLGEGEIYVQLV